MGETQHSTYEQLSFQEKRKFITLLLDQGKFDEIGKLPRFQIHEQANKSRDNNLDCYAWALSQPPNDSYNVVGRYDHFFLDNEPTQQPAPNDFVVYFKGGEMQHMGLYLRPNIVRSKFGSAHVYDHPTLEVPDFYMGEVRFYTRKKANESGFHFPNNRL